MCRINAIEMQTTPEAGMGGFLGHQHLMLPSASHGGHIRTSTWTVQRAQWSWTLLPPGSFPKGRGPFSSSPGVEGTWHLVPRPGVQCAEKASHQNGRSHPELCLGKVYVKLRSLSFFIFKMKALDEIISEVRSNHLIV